MSDITRATFADGPPALQELYRRTRYGLILGEDTEILMYGAEHGMFDPDEALTGSADWRDPEVIEEFLVTTGARAAWEADQRARSVPLDCPAWCNGKHGFDNDPLRDVLAPYDAVASHETELIHGKHIGVDLVCEQVHPDSGKSSRDYVVMFGGRSDLQIPVDDLDDVIATLQAAKVRIADLTGSEQANVNR